MTERSWKELMASNDSVLDKIREGQTDGLEQILEGVEPSDGNTDSEDKNEAKPKVATSLMAEDKENLVQLSELKKQQVKNLIIENSQTPETVDDDRHKSHSVYWVPMFIFTFLVLFCIYFFFNISSGLLGLSWYLEASEGGKVLYGLVQALSRDIGFCFFIIGGILLLLGKFVTRSWNKLNGSEFYKKPSLVSAVLKGVKVGFLRAFRFGAIWMVINKLFNNHA